MALCIRPPTAHPIDRGTGSGSGDCAATGRLPSRGKIFAGSHAGRGDIVLEDAASDIPWDFHFEIAAGDLERAVRFYQKAFGSRTENWDGPSEFWRFTTGPSTELGIDGGIGWSSEAGRGHTETTLGVDSFDSARGLIVDCGGKLVRSESAVPGVGWLAHRQCAEDNRHGLM